MDGGAGAGMSAEPTPAEEVPEPPPPPPTITARKRGTGHSYEVNGRPAKGVTTLIKGGVPAPALTYWAADEAARFAVENPDLIGDLGAVKAYEKIRRSPWRERDRKALIGTDIHKLAERLGRGEEVEVRDDLVPYVDAALTFMEEHSVRVLASEATVASVRWHYAGTLDLIAETAHGRLLIDYKTGSGVYVEAALQLAAYRYAEWMLDPYTGDVVPMPEVEGAAVCHLRPDGYSLVPVVANRDVHRTFIYAAQVALALDGARDALIGEPLGLAS